MGVFYLENIMRNNINKRRSFLSRYSPIIVPAFLIASAAIGGYVDMKTTNAKIVTEMHEVTVDIDEIKVLMQKQTYLEEKSGRHDVELEQHDIRINNLEKTVYGKNQN